jgi:tripartite-type tricarboxylate transporter receptor subunit TctC
MNACRLALSALLSISALAANAQSYPVKPIRLIVPFPPGGPNDIIGRLVAQKTGEALGRQMVVDNRAGAGGNIGTALVAKSPPDGYTLLSGGMGSLIMNPIIEKAPYDPQKDFAPVILMASAPNVLVTHPSLPVKNVKELIALAQARPAQLNYGSGGVGSTPHLSGALFNTMARVNIVHVPYKGNAPAITDLIGGQVQLAFLGIPPVQPHVAGGKLRALAVTGSRPSATLPAIPTVSQSGVPGYEISPWYGILAPTGTPADIVLRLNDTIAKVVAAPDMSEKLTAVGAEPENTTPGEYAARIKSDVDKWSKVIRDAKITSQ